VLLHSLGSITGQPLANSARSLSLKSLKGVGYRIRIILIQIKIRIQLFTLIRSRIQLFTSMRIRIMILWIMICDHQPSDPPGLHFEPPRLHFEPSKLLNFDYNADPDSLLRILIQHPKTMRIRIRNPGTVKPGDIYRIISLLQTPVKPNLNPGWLKEAAVSFLLFYNIILSLACFISVSDTKMKSFRLRP
jgi:hypothetical protein